MSPSGQLAKARARWVSARRVKQTRQHPEHSAMGTVSPGLLMGGLVVFLAGAALMGGWAGKVAREERRRGR